MLLDRKRTLPCLYWYWSREILITRRILDLISSFLSLLEQPLSCISVLGVGDKLGDCLASTLPGTRRAKVVNTYGPDEFEKSLEMPTAQIREIERHDFCPILDYLLMKLRTALDRDWLHSLPTLHKVVFSLLTFVLVSKSKNLLIVFHCVIKLEYSLQEASIIIEQLSAKWDHVRQHHNQASRLPVYRFHMRKVGFLQYMSQTSEFHFILFFVAFSQTRSMNASGWIQLTQPAYPSYVALLIIVSCHHLVKPFRTVVVVQPKLPLIKCVNFPIFKLSSNF